MNSNYYSNSLLSYMDKEDDFTKMKKVVRGKDMDSLLFDLLTTVSPHGKEEPIVDMIIKAISKHGKCEVDVLGNLIVKVGDYKKSRVMFSCHTDTVQRSTGRSKIDLMMSEDGWVRGTVDSEHYTYIDAKGNTISKRKMEEQADEKQKFMNYILLGKGKYKKLYGSDNDFDDWHDTGFKFATKTEIKPKGSILGADDKLGCYIMCNLIKHEVPALYVFHVGEECGGIGSTHISEKTPEIVKGMDYCIAFDRYGYNDVITSQSGGTCCSNEFADAFCKEVNAYLPPKEQMAPSTRGTFTDSANYTSLISECTNIAVGYKDQHSTSETFDLEWLERMLIPALLKVKWSELPVKRDKNVKFGYGGYNGYGRYTTTRRTYPSLSNHMKTSSRNTSSLYRSNQSALDKIENAIDKLDSFDPEEGFRDEETHKQKVDRVLYSWIREEMTLKDIAEQVVEAMESSPRGILSEEDERFGYKDYWL